MGTVIAGRLSRNGMAISRDRRSDDVLNARGLPSH